MGGATGNLTLHTTENDGLSPRGRGNQRNPAWWCVGVGSIPAWAGQPPPARSRPALWRVYPRVGGATVLTAPTPLLLSGLSPRGRGNRRRVERLVLLRRSIPAWAGQPIRDGPGGVGNPVYPRVGGATMRGSERESAALGLSPRGRGNPLSRALHPGGGRSIPAWAGQPQRAFPTARSTPVYPRVGGATLEHSFPGGAAAGLSPRGRGNQHGVACADAYSGSIPAWAGQPAGGSRITSPRRVYPRVGGATT